MSYTIVDNKMIINEGEYVITIDPEPFLLGEGVMRRWPYYSFQFSHKGKQIVGPDDRDRAIFSPSPLAQGELSLFSLAASFMLVNHDDGVEDDFFQDFGPAYLAWIDSQDQENFGIEAEEIFGQELY